MENVGALHSLGIKTTKRVEIAAGITTHLRERYNDVEASVHADAVANLQRLRNELTDLAADAASAEKLRRYLGELDVYLQTVPSQPADAAFPWTDICAPVTGVMSYLLPWSVAVVSKSSWVFERSCVIFNIAAIESALADATPLLTEESCGSAQRLYTEAAAKFAYLREYRERERADNTGVLDLSQPALTMFGCLMRARAAVCEYRARSVKKAPKNQLASVLAQAIQPLEEGKRAVLSAGTEGGNLEQAYPWSLMLTLDSHLLTLVMYLEMAMHTVNDFGVGFAWGGKLRDQNDVVADCLTSRCAGFVDLPLYAARYAKLDPLVKLQQAENSRSIADHRVDERALLVPPSAPIAIPLLTDTSFRSIHSAFNRMHSRDAFTLLEQTDLRVTKIAMECSAKADAAKLTYTDLLRELALPGRISEAYGMKSIPMSLWARIEAVQREGGMAALQQIVERNHVRAQYVTSLLGQARDVLAADVAADTAAAADFRDRWDSIQADPSFQELQAELTRYNEVLPVAQGVDATVNQKLERHRDALATLMLKRPELETRLPPQYQAKPDAAGCDADRVAQQLLSAMARGDAMSSSLPALASAVRTSYDREALARELRSSAPTSWPSTVERMALAQSPAALSFEAALAELTSICQRLRALADEFDRQVLASPAQEAQRQFCAVLEGLLTIYADLSDNVQEAECFYNELQVRVEKLLDTARKQQARNIMRRRELQAQQLLSR